MARNFRKEFTKVETKETETEKVNEKEPVKKQSTKPRSKYGVVKAKAARLNVRSAPLKTDNNVIAVINAGSKVKIFNIEVPDGWFNVETEITPGVTVRGYVKSEFIEE